MRTNDIQISLPTSKSLTIRWLMANHISGGTIPLSGISTADDVKALRRVLANDAVACLDRDRTSVTRMPQTAEPNDTGTAEPATLDCGESATVARFMLAYLATRPCGTVVLDGAVQLRRRPMDPLVKALRELGGPEIEYLGEEGCLPLKVSGNWPEMKLAVIDPTVSGQYVSALAMAAAALPRGMHIRMSEPPASRSYIKMTCSVLSQAGAANDYAANHTTLRIQPLEQHHFAHPVQIERDWSAAAFFYMAAVFLPHRRIRLTGLTLQSLQGDSVTAELFKSLGVKTVEARSPYRKTRSVVIEGGGDLRSGLVHDFSDCPDLAIPVAVACAAMGVEAWLSGLQTLRYKECNRTEALVTELRKMGGNVESGNGRMHIAPSALMPTEPVCTYGDHRMAMAFGVLTLLFPDMVVEGRETVTKSFPDFWDQLALVDQ